jgi:hypothetical protein
MSIIYQNCPKANTKNIKLGDRTPIALVRRFDSVKKLYPFDETIGEVVSTKEQKSSGTNDGGETSSNKRKAAVVKKGTAKKMKPTENESLNGGGVKAWLDNVDQDELEEPEEPKIV